MSLVKLSNNGFSDYFPLLSPQVFDQLFGEFLPQIQHTNGFPKSEVKQTENELIFQLALAGYSEEQLTVEACDDTISVKADKCNKEEDENLFASRAFSWSRKDPNGIWDCNKANVKFKNGMLTIKIRSGAVI